MSACQEDKSKQAKLMREKKKKRLGYILKIGLDFKCISCGKQPKKTILVCNEEMRM